MEKITYTYFCDVCRVELNDGWVRTNVHLQLKNSERTVLVKAWQHLCEEHFSSLYKRIADTINAYPINKYAENIKDED